MTARKSAARSKASTPTAADPAGRPTPAADQPAPLTIPERLAQGLPGWTVCPDCGRRAHGDMIHGPHDVAERRDDGIHTVRLGDVALRAEGEDGAGRTLHGYAYRWGELTAEGATPEFGNLAEGFERGAFAQAIAERGGRPWPFLDRHRGTVVAGITFAEDDTGLRYEGQLLATPSADSYAATIPAGNDGVSLEFVHRGAVSQRRGRTIIHTSIPRIAALAGEYVPAYQGATVALRSEGEGTMNTCETCGAELTAGVAHTCSQGVAIPMTRDQIASLATDAATEVMRQYAERGALTTAPQDPLLAYRSLGELVHAAARSEDAELRAYAARAIAHRVLDDTTFNSGANAALANGNLVTNRIARIVNRGRRAITAFGGPRPLGDIAGLTLNWPYFDGTLADFVAAQSAEKAEIISASVDIKLGTEALVTYAGGSDISYQVIRRGSPSVLDAYAQIWLAAWAAVTDAAFVTELESGSVTADLTAAIGSATIANITAGVVEASLAVDAATGRGAEFILASTTAFSRIANLLAPTSNQLVVSGQMDLTGLTVALGNLPVIHVPSITAGKFIVSNELAAAWYEDGPFQASADDVEKLGRNVAYWSLGAGARFIPAGIVELYDVTP
jgi:HK97 family phage prohead protease